MKNLRKKSIIKHVGQTRSYVTYNEGENKNTDAFILVPVYYL